LLNKIFGSNVSSVTDAMERSSGVKTSSATDLMALAAPLVLGVLGKRAATQKLDSSGLANLLMSEKLDTAAATPAGLAQLLNPGPKVVSANAGHTREAELDSPTHLEHFVESNSVAVEHAPVAPPPEKSGLGWLPLSLAAFLALGLLWALRGSIEKANVGDVASRGIDTAKKGLEQISLPGGIKISAAPGSINYDLAKFLGDPSAQGPKTFLFDNLNFDAATTQLTAESQPRVNVLATILKSYPNTQVQLVGYTDNTGPADANLTLYQNRSDAVKALLVNQGVGAERISTQGLGQNKPVASNDTEEGRLKNRRTELIVNSK